MEVLDSLREARVSLVLTIVAVCIGYLILQLSGLPQIVHRFSHAAVELGFTGTQCYVRNTPDRYTDDPFKEEAGGGFNCTPLLLGDGYDAISAAGYAGESIAATLLILSPASAVGGVWFGLIGERLLTDERKQGAELRVVSPQIVRFAGIGCLIVFLCGVCMQFDFFRRKRMKRSQSTMEPPPALSTSEPKA